MTQVRLGTDAEQRHAPEARPLRRRRGLPNGRAVVGGFLVALAAVGMFSAYATVTAGPTTNYVVAARDLQPGDRIDATAVALVAIDLPDAQRRRAFDVVDPLLDATVVEPLVEGELLQEGSLVATGAEPGTRSLSFAIDPARAVNAALRPGERVDVLATFGTGSEACTSMVAAGIPLVAVDQGGANLGGQQGAVTVTVQVTDADESVAVAHAASAGAVTLVRTTSAETSPPQRVCTPAAGDPSGSDG